MAERKKSLAALLLRKRVSRHRNKRRNEMDPKTSGIEDFLSDSESISIPTTSSTTHRYGEVQEIRSGLVNIASTSDGTSIGEIIKPSNEEQPIISPQVASSCNSSESSSADSDVDGPSDIDIGFHLAEESDDELELRSASETEEEEEAEENDDGAGNECNEIEELRGWALSGNPTIPQTRVDQLLQILRKRLLPDLRKSSKTFLGTTKAVYSIEKNPADGSEFVYFGLEQHLAETVNPALHKNNIIDLMINVDGLQLYKSSNKQFWPILCKVFSLDNVYKPFPVSIYSGNQKPNDINKYLEKFVNEVNELQARGLIINGQQFTISLKCFICDRPARALLKCIKGHGGYWACERSEVRGERVEKRTIHPVDVRDARRSDYSFRNQSNPDHHTGRSPLLDIKPPIDMITSFVLDFMHLVFLGVMKKLLSYWLRANSKTRISNTNKIMLSNVSIQLQTQISCEFQRTTRSLNEIDRFKAVEFAFILLYAGPILFKKILSENIYKHFLLLHIACRILCSKTRTLVDYEQADSLLRKFVEIMPRFYGSTCLIGTVHNLIHLASDVFQMNCSIPYFTAFPFENALGRLKNLLRNGNKPLAQVCRRLHEAFFINTKRATVPREIEILRCLKADRAGRSVVKRVRYQTVILSQKFPDNCVKLKNGKSIEIDYMYHESGHDDDIYITGTILKKIKPLLTFPCNSEMLDMWVVHQKNLRSGPHRLDQVLNKIVMLRTYLNGKEKLTTMPLLHM